MLIGARSLFPGLEPQFVYPFGPAKKECVRGPLTPPKWHFAAFEQPKLLSEEIRTGFRQSVVPYVLP